MNVPSIFRTVCQGVSSIVPRIPPVKPLANIISRNMHHICNKSYLNSPSTIYTNTISSSTFLQPSLPMYNLVCGLKMKTVLQRRCKHCILLWKNDRKYIMCKAKPRHNQVERKKKLHNTWILSHASQNKKREW